MSIRIVVADDHPVIREGLRALIETQPNMELVGEAGDGRTAVELAETLRPDVMVLDISMPDLNGIEAARQVLARCPQVKVIALSMHRDLASISKMLEAGASAYMLKTSGFAEIAHAIELVAEGHSYLAADIAGTVVTDYVRRLADGQQAAGQQATGAILTDREREVLQLLAEGRSTKQIAGHLHVSVKTVITHRQHIMDKLGFGSMADLVKYAIREGITSLEI